MLTLSTMAEHLNENLLDAIRKFACFSQEELSLLTEKLVHRNLNKDEKLVKAGEVSGALYFVVNGAFRQFKITNDDEEVTVGLYIDGDWMMDHRSFTSQKPSENFITAFTDSEVFELNIHDIHTLIGMSQTFFQLGKILESVVYASDRYRDQTKPETKYEYLMANNPLIIQRFPLKYIASYLQITPETLSRVRKKIASS